MPNSHNTDSDPVPVFGPPTTAQAKAIRRTIDLYVKGLRDGDVRTLMQAFSDDAVVCGYIGGTEGFVKPVSFLYRFVLETPPPAKTGERYACEITEIVVAGQVAKVTVAETDYIKSDYVTTFHLIYLADSDAGTARWWIVSKLFQGTAPRRAIRRR